MAKIALQVVQQGVRAAQVGLILPWQQAYQWTLAMKLTRPLTAAVRSARSKLLPGAGPGLVCCLACPVLECCCLAFCPMLTGTDWLLCCLLDWPLT